MKKVLATMIGLGCALALTLNAAVADKKPHKRTPEQKALLKEMLSKYDADKNGKLSKEEQAKISSEDREKMQKAGLGQKKKNKENKTAK